MEKNPYPFTMPAELKTNWLVGMRSGEYLQAQNRLCDVVRNKETGEDCKGYCCLGVLQMVADGTVELSPHKMPYGDEYYAEALPTDEWYQTHGIFGSASVVYEGKKTSLAELNDNFCLSFAEIADLVEQQVETTQDAN